MKYKMTLSYDGKKYAGWQIQPHSISIQETIQKALSSLLKEPINITSAGRTDSGVHAIEQTAHFIYIKELDEKQLLYKLNCILPKDIRIKDISPISDDFHARFSATHKIYHYFLSLKNSKNPFTRDYSFYLKKEIDVALLKKAALLFIGKNDFTSFANVGSSKSSPIKHLKRLDVIETEDGIRLEFEGDGFLYKMVRNIVGTLLDVAMKKITLDSIPKIFNAKDRRKASKTAPSHALFLVKVFYNNLS